MSRRHPAPEARADAAGDVLLMQATVRPDATGRTHPDPRLDPPTVDLDPARARTTELQLIGPDTDPIPVVPADAGDPDTTRLPAVEPDRDPDDYRDDYRDDDTPPRGSRVLASTALVGALAGLAGWLVAARVLPPDVVGDAQLVVSVFLVAGGAAQLGLGLVRRPSDPTRYAGRLAWGTLLLAAPLSGLVGLALVGTGLGLLAPRLTALPALPDGLPTTALVAVAVICAVWGVFAAHDLVLAAAGRAGWALWRTALFAVAQIAALVVVTDPGLLSAAGPAVVAAVPGLLGPGPHGVVLSWVAPMTLWVVLGLPLVAVLARRARAAVPAVRAAAARPPAAQGPAAQGPAALSLVGAMLLCYLVPLVVNARFGAETGAAFFVAWQVFLVVDLAAGYSMTSLSAAVERAPERAGELVATARRRLLVVFLPALALAVVLADPLLGVFGAGYAEASDLLRLLLLGLAFRLVVTHELGVRQALGRGVGFGQLQLVSTLLVLVVATVVPVSAVGVAALRPVAIGYIVVQVACAAAVLVLPATRRTDVEVPAP